MKFIDTTGQTNWKFIAIVAIVALVVGGGLMVYLQSPPQEEVAQIVLSQEDETAELSLVNLVLSDEEVLEILVSFAQTQSYIEKPEVGSTEILLSALELKDQDMKEGLVAVKKGLNDWGSNLNDAPDLRSFAAAFTKACIAEAIIYNDLRNTLQRCDVDDKMSENVWIGENGYNKADDITAVVQILPYFLTAISYNTEGDMLKAEYYTRQVKFHKEAMIVQYGENSLVTAGELYERIFEKIASIETADWQTYRNEEFGFEVKYPPLSKIEEAGRPSIIFAKDALNRFENVSLGICNDFDCVDLTTYDLLPYPVEKDEMFVGGNPGLRYSYQYKFDPQSGGIGFREEDQELWRNIMIDVTPRDSIYPIYRFSYSAAVDNEELFETFDQILSTFRFIE